MTRTNLLFILLISLLLAVGSWGLGHYPGTREGTVWKSPVTPPKTGEVPLGLDMAAGGGDLDQEIKAQEANAKRAWEETRKSFDAIPTSLSAQQRDQEWTQVKTDAERLAQWIPDLGKQQVVWQELADPGKAFGVAGVADPRGLIMPQPREAFFVDSAAGPDGRLDFAWVPAGNSGFWLSMVELEAAPAVTEFKAGGVDLGKKLPCRSPREAEWLAAVAAKNEAIKQLDSDYGEWVTGAGDKPLVMGKATIPGGLKPLADKEWNQAVPEGQRKLSTRNVPSVNLTTAEVNDRVNKLGIRMGLNQVEFRNRRAELMRKVQEEAAAEAAKAAPNETTFRHRWLVETIP